MKFSFNSFVPKLTLAAALVGTLAGCDDPEYATPQAITTASTAQARYQVVNAAPGGNNAQLLSIDNVAPATAFAPIPYLGTATYSSLSAGQRLLLFSVTGNLNNQQVAVRPTFNTGSSSTIFLTDSPTRPASGTDPGGVRSVVLTDNLSAPAVATNAKIRFVNLATTGTYGIYNATTAPATSLFSAVPFRASRAITNTTTTTPAVTTNFANFTEVAAGAYTLDVRASATAPATPTPIAGTQLQTTFAPGKIYTLYVRGTAGNATNPLGISVVTHN